MNFLSVSTSEFDSFKLLCSYQGHVSAALVLGGVDITGPHLHTVIVGFEIVHCFIGRREYGKPITQFLMTFFANLSSCQLTPSHLLQWDQVHLLQCLYLSLSTRKV